MRVMGLNYVSRGVCEIKIKARSNAAAFTYATRLEPRKAKQHHEGAIAEYDSMIKEAPGSLVVANNLASLLADRRTDKGRQANRVVR